MIAACSSPPEHLRERDLLTVGDVDGVSALHALRVSDVGGDVEGARGGGCGSHWAEGEEFISGSSDGGKGGAVRARSDDGSIDEGDDAETEIIIIIF